MQLNTIDVGQLAELLDEADNLHSIDNDGQLIHVLHHAGLDMLAIVNPVTGGAACVYPGECFDAPTIHAEARAMMAEA